MFAVTMPMRKGEKHHWSKDPSEKATKQPYVPTGKPRGRPPKPEDEKITTPYVPTGKPRGRPKKDA